MIWRDFGRRREVMLGLLLLGLTVAVYGQVCRFDFVAFDDPVYVLDNPHVREGLSFRGLGWAFVTFHGGNWIPLTWLSLMLDATVYGTWAGGYHLTNLLLHAANVLLVFTIFAYATGNSSKSAFMAALFAVHPLHAESVAWVTERKDVLSMLFALSSLFAYVQYARLRTLRRLVLALCFFACSLLAKQTFVTLPFVFLLLDYWPLRRQCKVRETAVESWQVGPLTESARDAFPVQKAGRPRLLAALVAEKLPFLALSGVFCVVVVWAQSTSEAVMPLASLPLTSRLANAVLAYGWYALKAFVPLGLAAFYPHPGTNLNLTAFVAASIFLAATSLVAIVQVRRRPFLLVGWFWYLGTLVPMIGLVQVGAQQMADRYAYFPMLGLYLAVAWLVPSLLPDFAARRRVLEMAAAGSVALYGAIGFVQVGYWRDGATLFQHALDVTPDNPFARVSLGCGLLARGDFADSIQHFQRAVDLAPNYSLAHFFLGCALQKSGSLEEAARHYRAAITFDDWNVSAHNNLGEVLVAQHRYTDAERQFKRTLLLDENNGQACLGLAAAYRESGKPAESVRYGERALQIDPNSIASRRLLGLALGDQGRLDEAIRQFQDLLALSPDDAEARTQLQRLTTRKDDGSHGEHR